MENYEELKAVEHKLWQLERDIKEEDIKDRIFEARYNLIKILLKMKEKHI